MNVHKYVLLALTSAAIFGAAPITAQVKWPGGNSVQPVAVDPGPHSVRPMPVDPQGPPAPYYALKVEAGADRFAILEGIPGVPVALMVGAENGHFMLPGNAMLRVDPQLVFILGDFDRGGTCNVNIDTSRATPVPHFEVFMQAISITEDWRKLCTSELIWVRTDLACHWEFDLRG